jgi:hypothetical protein
MINKLRIGLILPGERIPAWIAKTLGNIHAFPEVEILTAVIAPTDVESKWLNNLHYRIDRNLFHSQPDPGKSYDLKGAIGEIPTIAGLDEGKSARLQSLKLDVLINLSIICYPDYLLDCARYGVWTLYDGEDRFVAGSPVGHRELLTENSLLVCAIEVARHGQTSQIPMRSVMAGDPYSISRNQGHLFWKASVLLPNALKRLAMFGEQEFFARAEAVTKTGTPSFPTPSQTLQLSLLQIKNKLDKETRKLYEFNQWSLMVRPGGMTGPLRWDGFHRLVPPKDRLWADPFVVEREGRAYIFFEEFKYKSRRGHINCVELDRDGRAVSNQTVLERPYHLSYPFIFRDRGEWYMLPETAGNRTIETYRCTRFPDQWEFDKVLMSEVSAVDTTLLEHAGRWWMFANIAEYGNPGWDSLHLFYADSPISDHWTPHPRNPIVSDVHSARPAGPLFRRDGNLFRPSQDCSRRYGYALNINRVTTLNTTDYAEVLEERLEPPTSSDILATHTISSTSNWTVIDVNVHRKK